MAVYKHTYTPYSGRFTAWWLRWSVVARYSLESLFAARTTLVILAASAFVPVVDAVIVYLNNNVDALPLIGAKPSNLVPVNEQFFFLLMNVQAFWAFVMTAWAGPTLVSPDLVDNALPLYLSRPLSRAEYVLGKMAVLVVPLSLIQLVPPLLLWAMHARMAGNGWWSENLWLAWAIIAGAGIWIVFLSLFALAISALVRWRIVAAALQFGIFLCAAAFSEAINAVMQTTNGYLINAGHVVGTIWMELFRANTRNTVWKKLFSVNGTDMTQWQAWTALAVFCAIFVLILNRRLRGREVVS